jgi:hypothetical protein
MWVQGGSGDAGPATGVGAGTRRHVDVDIGRDANVDFPVLGGMRDAGVGAASEHRIPSGS